MYPPALIPLSSQKCVDQGSWLHDAKLELTDKVRAGVQHRINNLENIINSCMPSNTRTLIIEESIRNQITQQILVEVSDYKGTRLLCRNEEKSRRDVIQKTRTWWNRTKPTKLGKLMFNPICFYLLHNFIAAHCVSFSLRQRFILFLEIFEKFLERTIKFKKTKPKPLIPHTCFFQAGSFKDICSFLVEIFGDGDIEWHCYIPIVKVQFANGKATKKYIRQKTRCSDLYRTFCESITKIKEKIMYTDDRNNLLQSALNKWEDKIRSIKPKHYNVAFVQVNEDENDNENDNSIFINNDANMDDANNDTQPPNLEANIDTREELQIQPMSEDEDQSVIDFNDWKNKYGESDINEGFVVECKVMQIPQECRCNCDECVARIRCNEAYDASFETITIENESRTTNQVTIDILWTSQKTQMILEKLKYLWLTGKT